MGASRIHLIVLIHGLYGNPDNLAVVKEELERASPSSRTDKGKRKAREVDDESEVEALLDGAGSDSDDRLEVQVLVCKSFTGSHTWDGIDVNAHKAAKEIDDKIKRLGKEGKVVEVFSLVRPLLRLELMVDGLLIGWSYVVLHVAKMRRG
jgi:hypothetical protein